MAYSEPKEIEDEDWRLHAVTTLAKGWTSPDTGIFHPRGAKVMLAAMVRTSGEKILQFGIPNMSALCIDISDRMWREEKQLLSQIFIPTRSKHMPKGTQFAANHSLLF